MWQLQGSVGQASFGDFTLSVNTASGHRQLVVQNSDGVTLATLWNLPVVNELPAIETYVRGDDLVCVVAASEAFPFTTQLYWTLRTLEGSPQPAAAVTLSLSIRTELLDTEPAIEVVSQTTAGSFAAMDLATGPAYTMAIDPQTTLLDYAVPEDCSQQTAPTDSSVERTLFGHFLEKGVIRSGQLHAALVPGELTPATATELSEAMAASELPLGT